MSWQYEKKQDTLRKLGQQEILLRRMPEEADKLAGDAMTRSVLEIIRQARPFVPVGVSGDLKDSLVHEVRETSAMVKGRVYSSLTDEAYPSVVHDGRRSGAAMPPPKALERWVRVKLRVSQKDLAGVAFVVSRSIGRRGIKGKPFLIKGYKKAEPRIEQWWARVCKEAVRRAQVK